MFRNTEPRRLLSALLGRVPSLAPSKRASPNPTRGDLVSLAGLATSLLRHLADDYELVHEEHVGVCARLVDTFVQGLSPFLPKSKAFLSHYKERAGTDALALKLAMEPLGQPCFLDSDDLKNLGELRGHVLTSKTFYLLLSPHPPDHADKPGRFGPFSRPYCLVEIVTAQQVRMKNKDFPVVGVRIHREGFDDREIPASEAQVRGLVDAKAWSMISMPESGKT